MTPQVPLLIFRRQWFGLGYARSRQYVIILREPCAILSDGRPLTRLREPAEPLPCAGPPSYAYDLTYPNFGLPALIRVSWLSGDLRQFMHIWYFLDRSWVQGRGRDRGGNDKGAAFLGGGGQRGNLGQEGPSGPDARVYQDFGFVFVALTTMGGTVMDRGGCCLCGRYGVRLLDSGPLEYMTIG